MYPDDVNQVQHLEDHNYSLRQVNGQIMNEATTFKTGALPNIPVCKSIEKQGITNTSELDDMILLDNTECRSYQNLKTAESGNEDPEGKDSEYFASDSGDSDSDDDNSQTLPQQKILLFLRMNY